MEITWGFLAIFILILIPGLIIRRLYFYSEFSKQFGYYLPLLKLVFYALIPGTINAVGAFLLFDWFFISIDLGEVIDGYKVLSDPEFSYVDTGGKPIKTVIKSGILPYVAFSWFSAIFVGSVGGRLVRNLGLDTISKLFRFQNQWFYLFSRNHQKLPKFKFLQSENRKYLFTEADVLIDANQGTVLYSGIIVDYDLDPEKCQELRRIILRDSKRYSRKKKTRKPKPIPGDLLVVDCAAMVNLNLTYVYGQSQNFLKSIWPRIIFWGFSIIYFLILPILFFQVNWIGWSIYESFFDLSIIGRVMSYLFVVQTISLCNPFVEEKKEFQWITSSFLFTKLVIWEILGYLCLWLFW